MELHGASDTPGPFGRLGFLNPFRVENKTHGCQSVPTDDHSIPRMIIPLGAIDLSFHSGPTEIGWVCGRPIRVVGLPAESEDAFPGGKLTRAAESIGDSLPILFGGGQRFLRRGFTGNAATNLLVECVVIT